jgi:hypothetical protein
MIKGIMKDQTPLIINNKMPILDNDYPYMDCIRFNDDYTEEAISTINRTLEINLSDIKKQYTNYHYKIIMNKKDFEIHFRDLNKRYIREFMNKIVIAFGQKEYNWNLYNIITHQKINEFEIDLSMLEQDDEIEETMRRLKNENDKYSHETDAEHFERIWKIANEERTKPTQCKLCKEYKPKNEYNSKIGNICEPCVKLHGAPEYRTYNGYKVIDEY